MYQLCGLPIRQLFLANDDEKNALSIQSNGSPRIDLSVIDVQWLQVYFF